MRRLGLAGITASSIRKLAAVWVLELREIAPMYRKLRAGRFVDDFQPFAHSECFAVHLPKWLGWKMPGAVVPRCENEPSLDARRVRKLAFSEQHAAAASAALNRKGKHTALLKSESRAREQLMSKRKDSFRGSQVNRTRLAAQRGKSRRHTVPQVTL